MERALAIQPTKPPVGQVKIPILMYHYIRDVSISSPDKLGYGLSVGPRLFDDQLGYLSTAGYHSISMDELTAYVTTGKVLPSKPVVITFDDGYADLYNVAMPLLNRYGFSATAYIVPDFVGRPGYISWGQLNELNEGFEIGAHTMDHVDLAIQTSAIAWRQIDQSRTVLRQRTGRPVNTFAYPSGRFNAAVAKQVAEAGFSSAVTTNFGSRFAAKDLITLPRVRVPGGISLPNFIKNLES
jgi:peptidoglycan/xylan/chitin deacetylase (PgdA/CDA1 family)